MDKSMELKTMEIQIAEKEMEIKKLQMEVQILKQKMDLVHMQKTQQPETEKALIPEELKQASCQAQKSYVYVIFNGEKRGIHQNIDEEKLPLNIKYKRCDSFEKAEEELKNYQEPISLRPQTKIQTPVKTLKLTKEQAIRMKIPMTKAELQGERNPNKEKYCELFRETFGWQKQKYLDQPWYTIWRPKTGPKMVTLPGYNPLKLWHAVQYGFVELIYLSGDHRELECFPENVKIAIRLWKDRKAFNKNTFIKILSCYCSFEDKIIKPKSYMQLGFSNGTSPPADESQMKEILKMDEHYYRAQQLYYIYLSLEKIYKDTKIKVNFKSKDILITSFFNEVIPEKEYVHILHWLKDFYCMENLEFPDQTQEFLCELLKSHENHVCPKCEKEKQMMESSRIIEDMKPTPKLLENDVSTDVTTSIM